jgi:hypothetical protein
MDDQTIIMLVVAITGVFVLMVYGVAIVWVLYHTPSLETANDILQDDTNTIRTFGNTSPLPPWEPPEPEYDQVELIPYTQNVSSQNQSNS